MQTLKKIGSIVLDVLVVLVFVVSVILIIANATSDKKNGGQPNVFGYVINSVQTDSMTGTFEVGALVIGKIPDENTQIVAGETIITFRDKDSKGNPFNNTHRVIATKQVGSTTMYQTQGDKPGAPVDPEWKTMSDIQAVYVGHVEVVGGIIDFIKKPIGFVLVLVLPMLAFIGYQIYKLVVIYMAAKKEEILEEAKAGVSDEAKDAIIKEYLAKMQAEQNSADEQNSSQDESQQN